MPEPDSPRKSSLAVLFLAVFIDLLGFGIVLPLLPIYAKHFTTDKSGLVVGLLMSSFSIMQFFFAPIWGRLSDRIGRRPVLMIGLAGSTLFYALFGVATVLKDLTLLFVSRIGAGVAGATISTAQAYIADSTSLAKRPKGMALIGAAFGLGFTFGPLIGLLSMISSHDNPGAAPGYVAAGLSFLALTLAWFKLPESYKPGAAKPRRRMFNFDALRNALATPSVALLLFTSFVCVFSFANFESTVALLIKGKNETGLSISPFDFSFHEVFLTFAFIGLILTVTQGGLVRRLAGRFSEGALASTGALIEVVGFVWLVQAIRWQSSGALFGALAVVVCGFAFMTPSINSLISRRSDPAKQGAVLGLGQSANSLARILGPMVGVPLIYRHASWPYWLAAGLMALGGLLVLVAVRGGTDYAASHDSGSSETEA